jgi:hypothetical protein
MAPRAMVRPFTCEIQRATVSNSRDRQLISSDFPTVISKLSERHSTQGGHPANRGQFKSGQVGLDGRHPLTPMTSVHTCKRNKIVK